MATIPENQKFVIMDETGQISTLSVSDSLIKTLKDTIASLQVKIDAASVKVTDLITKNEALRSMIQLSEFGLG
jgi:hypothetical protein